MHSTDGVVELDAGSSCLQVPFWLVTCDEQSWTWGEHANCATHCHKALLARMHLVALLSKRVDNDRVRLLHGDNVIATNWYHWDRAL